MNENFEACTTRSVGFCLPHLHSIISSQSFVWSELLSPH